MAGWESLLQSSLEQDIARKRANPGVANFGTFVQTAMALGMKKKEETEQEARAGRTAAKTAIYSKYPRLAAQELGVDTSTLPTTGITQPPGTALSQVTYDEYGNPQTTFKSTAVSEGDLADMYNRTILDIDKTNAQYSFMKSYKAIAKPTFEEWKKERGFSSAMNKSITTVSDQELLSALGISELQVEGYLRDNPNITREELFKQLRDKLTNG